MSTPAQRAAKRQRRENRPFKKACVMAKMQAYNAELAAKAGRKGVMPTGDEKAVLTPQGLAAVSRLNQDLG